MEIKVKIEFSEHDRDQLGSKFAEAFRETFKSGNVDVPKHVLTNLVQDATTVVEEYVQEI